MISASEYLSEGFCRLESAAHPGAAGPPNVDGCNESAGQQQLLSDASGATLVWSRNWASRVCRCPLSPAPPHSQIKGGRVAARLQANHPVHALRWIGTSGQGVSTCASTPARPSCAPPERLNRYSSRPEQTLQNTPPPLAPSPLIGLYADILPPSITTGYRYESNEIIAIDAIRPISLSPSRAPNPGVFDDSPPLLTPSPSGPTCAIHAANLPSIGLRILANPWRPLGHCPRLPHVSQLWTEVRFRYFPRCDTSGQTQGTPRTPCNWPGTLAANLHLYIVHAVMGMVLSDTSPGWNSTALADSICSRLGLRPYFVFARLAAPFFARVSFPLIFADP
ncbi:translation initiation factor 3, subunit i/TGF-beta receptor-interacting protein [Moesziomyces antarcticus T-34]|uniref:Translation initiation factor 3, subunit i/TGF-beta receptor-interacting protein n=1 Tax=Pseudozyma antarctica (strain T-34) TaxID=1151754 RepID=M9LWX9_PSEA3|nr:translation initiation factor 3, subunit i/TGF-beta receptor-interacting protein [Moesziomyces antarcticus T-34]